ncbi:MAG: hypothetical protein JWN29_2183 [Acidimicrobiales bacterium]|nr:hypothetical protein [Acidimicrobiales bacterium]
MARVSVFVDDAVRGTLPMLCVRDGAPADRHTRLEERMGGNSVLWFLLVFFGPLGWLVLLLLPSSGEKLTVRLPVCADTIARWRKLRRDRVVALAAVGVAVALLLVSHLAIGMWMLVAVAVVAVFVTHWRLSLDGVGIDLDASRRWVTLTGVSPAFAHVVEAERQAAERH